MNPQSKYRRIVSYWPRGGGGGNSVDGILGGLVAGTGYADIIVIGDSNASSSDATGARGYGGGFWDALDSGLVTEYATGLFETASASTTYARYGAPITNPNYQAAFHTASSYGNVWSRNNNGTTDRTSVLDSIWKPKYLKVNGVLKDFAYLESTSAQVYANAWLKVDHCTAAIGGISVRQALTVRWTFAKFPSQSTAQISTWIFKSAGGTVDAATTASMTNATGSVVLANIDRTISADATRTEIQCTYDANTTGKGPVACLVRSAFRSGVPGYSIHVMTHHAGSTTTQIKDALSDASGCGTGHIQTYLQMLAERQVAAGSSSGKVLVFINMGVNNGTASATANYVSDTQAIISQFKTAWSNLGYATSNLGFISTVTHPTSTFDPSGANSAAATAFANDAQVRFIDLQSLIPSWTSYYSPATQAHLNQSGYSTVASAIVSEIT